ncbi:DUF4040 domain-containing protein [Actinoalloteichus sp. AHMU CJ021]|uniref:Multicomponent Na+:H+ antiporter subunit A n=1 Tax=Actinoalloteichus caeruleus DSM 43889 TaxID=1120930 RepID=A0ABT1JN84_ACTCY|nr:DUF4040 family protein [Actinoalloteichus caeruleus]AUS79829.1 DUF4040 domain-containing protein [Actinoalloteichus sp. AHMU CJ021]MCP2333990.1 multicomponent Na+:H+ antiporter subunit A [Actinoalloteichus caeruleus DSM 43889]
MVLPLVLAALTALALAAPLLDRFLGRSTGWPLAAAFLGLAALVATRAPEVLSGAGAPSFDAPWMPAVGVGFHLRLDGLALLFVSLVLVVGALVMAYSASYFSHGRHGDFYLLMTLFAAAMFGLVLADDVVLLFVFWEITTICSFFLIGRSGLSASRPAVRTLILTAAGGLALLTAVVLMWVTTGTTRLSVILEHSAWTDDPAFATAVAVLVILAAFTKSAQFPFHYWLPDAMAASTPVSAYLHAAAMVKAGIYLLMRFSPALADHAVWQTALIGFGLVTAVLGALFALQRHDLKELLAYSTVSQLGFLVAIIGVGTPAAMAAATAHTLAHALFKATLFMLVGVVDREAGSRDIRKLTGLRRVMPVTATLTGLAALSMAGVPPLLGFVSKESMFGAFLDAPGPGWVGPVVGGVAVVGAILTFAYSFRLVYGAFGGPTEQSHLREPKAAFLFPAAVASVAGLVLGLVVPLLNPLVDRVVTDTWGLVHDSDLALWHGFSTALGMSVVVLGAGTVLFLRRAWLDRVLDRSLFPVRGTEVFERLYRGTIALGARVGDLTRSDSPAQHLAMPFVLLAVLASVALSAGLAVGDFPAPVSRPMDWVLVALIAASVLGAVVARSRLAALGSIGVGGFTVALWFFTLGAPDVGLTQLLVEVLTVVVAVLVLRRLPRSFHPTGRVRRAAAAVLAIVAGGVAALATYTMTGRRELSPAADYFLTEAENETGGTNVVNTILVDFRALDTLGELTVLGIAGLVIVAVLNANGLLPNRQPTAIHRFAGSPIDSPTDATILFRTVGRWLAPLVILLSAYLLLRGHYEPGGGFISALVGGAGFALAYLSAPSSDRAPIRWPYIALIASGVGVAVLTGVAGYLEGSFLRPVHLDIPLPWGGEYHFTSALVFDVGVYLAVIGVVVTALNRLGGDSGPPGGMPRSRGASRSGRSAGKETR